MQEKNFKPLYFFLVFKDFKALEIIKFMAIEVATTIDNYLKYQENIKSFSKLTLRAYRSDLTQAFENKQKIVKNYDELWALSRPAITKWASLSLSSRNRKIACLKSFFKWLYNEQLIETDYSSHLICPKIPKKIPHFLSVDEVISVLKYLNSGENKERQKTLFLLLYGSGLRISEACNLRWKDIKLNEKRMLVRGKGDKERLSIIPDFCIKHLNHISKSSAKNIFIFGSEPLNPRIGYEMIRQLGLKTGLMNPLHPHALRHSYATHLLASGANLRTLQTLLGHESLQATEKYTHLSVDQLSRLVERTHPLTKLKISG